MIFDKGMLGGKAESASKAASQITNYKITNCLITPYLSCRRISLVTLNPSDSYRGRP